MDHVVASARPDPFGARATLTTSLGTTVAYYRLAALEEQGVANIAALPFTIRILLENVLRNVGTEFVDETDVETLARWQPGATGDVELPFLPARMVLPD